MPRKPSKYGVSRKDFPTEALTAAAYQRAFRQTPEGKAHVRRMNLRAKGVTLAWYEDKLEEQGGVCAVCGTDVPGTNQHGIGSFAVDHDRRCCPGDRACGECARGLLCHNCNRAEGLLKGKAQALADYLERYEK